MQASIYFFSHAFTIILMNCNVCILQLQKNPKNEKKKTKQTKTPNKTKKTKNPKNKT